MALRRGFVLVVLDASQLDALTEQINICSGRAARTLSLLLGRRILLEPPEVVLCRVEKIPSCIGALLDGEMLAVHQHFCGETEGDAFLFLPSRHAAVLLTLLKGKTTDPLRLGTADYEALNEVGNIVLNAFLGDFANLLHIRIALSLPRVERGTLGNILRTSFRQSSKPCYAVVARVRFRVSGGQAEGHIVLSLTPASLRKLLDNLDGH